MAKRGRKSLTGKQQRSQGHKPTVAANATLEPPGDLDGDALAEWNRIVAALTESGRLRAVQWSTIRAAAVLWGMLQKLYAKVAEEGPTYADDKGRIWPNPAMDAISKFEGKHISRLEKLKITAYAMDRAGDVPVGKEPKADEEDERPGLRLAN